MPTPSPINPSLDNLTPLDFTSLNACLAGVGAWMDHALAHYVPKGEPEGHLYELAADYPNRGGKRFRPALLLICTGLVGGDPALALPSATALELFQNFALVHDDIEDGSELRRGKPALHRLHGVPLAINAGDLLFSLVFETLQDNHALLGAERAHAIQGAFLEVFRRTFEGQAYDIGWVAGNTLPGREEFERMISLKTGWYSGRGPCQLGALIGGADADTVRRAGDYGEALGIGFQLRDDLLNLTEDSGTAAPTAMGGGYGKERGGDFAEGKRTLIVIEMLERLSAADADRLREILTAPPEQTAPEDVRWAIDAADGCGAIAAVQARAAQQGQTAREALQSLPPGPHRDLLDGLTGYLIMERRA